jgi:hypothetical protein
MPAAKRPKFTPISQPKDLDSTPSPWDELGLLAFDSFTL